MIKEKKNKQFLKNLSRGEKNGFNDNIYTPEYLVKEIIDWVKPSGNILEPFYGDGAFYKELIKLNNADVDWTEIKKGKDFFKVEKHYNYIITNPPYSIFTKVMEKAFEISDNVVFLIPHIKLWASDKRIDMMLNYGDYEFKILKLPPKEVWPFRFGIAAYWFKRKDKDV